MKIYEVREVIELLFSASCGLGFKDCDSCPLSLGNDIICLPSLTTPEKELLIRSIFDKLNSMS